MNKNKKRQETKERYSGQRFFLGFGCGDAQGDFISRVRPASYSPQKWPGLSDTKCMCSPFPAIFMVRIQTAVHWDMKSPCASPHPKPRKNMNGQRILSFLFSEKGGTFYGITDSPRRRHGKALEMGICGTGRGMSRAFRNDAGICLECDASG